MENKCSIELGEAMKMYEIDSKLAPPHMHKRNAAERAITIWEKKSLDSQRQIQNPQSENGTDYSINAWSPWTFSAIPELIQLSQNMLTFLDHMTLINLLWHHLEPAWYFMKNLSTTHHGAIMSHQVCILVHHLTTTDVCSDTYPQLA